MERTWLAWLERLRLLAWFYLGTSPYKCRYKIPLLAAKFQRRFSRPFLALRDPHHHLLSMLSSQLSVLALHLYLSSRNIRDQDVSCSFERLRSGSDNSLKNLRPFNTAKSKISIGSWTSVQRFEVLTRSLVFGIVILSDGGLSTFLVIISQPAITNKQGKSDG